MRNRCFGAILAVFACCVLSAGDVDVVQKAAAACFGSPAPASAKDALARFEKEAASGNAAAQAHLGLFSLRGIGVKKDASRAFRLFREAASQGNLLGCFGVGYCLTTGTGCKRDCKAAVTYLDRAASGGNSDAMLLLFNIYRNGWAGDCDPAAALSMLRRAVLAGNLQAVCRFGYCYLNGELLPQNEEEAVRMFRTAADGGVRKDEDEAIALLKRPVERNNAEALVLMGDFYAQGTGVAKSGEKAVACYEKARKTDPVLADLALGRFYEKSDEAKSEAYLKSAADAGNVEALGRLGDRYLRGGKRVEQGISLLRRAADMGDVSSQLKVGRFYLKQLSPRERDKAFPYLKRAVDAGSIEALYFLSLCYRNGYGTKYDPALAADAARRSADAGNSYGQLLYGVYCRDGIGVKQDQARARRFFEMSALQDNRHARAALAELDISRSAAAGEKVYDEASLALLERSAKEGDINSKYLLGKIYTEGKGVARDYNRGRKYLEEAAAAKHPEALNLLGVYHARGIAGERSVEKMAACFKAAAELGSAAGFLNLGRCCFEGTGVKKDLKAAFENFSRSAELGSPEGEFWYGLCRLKGLGCKADPAAGFRTLRSAASNGWPEACCYVGLCYLDGTGVKRDPQLAFRFFRQGAELGSSDAMYQLGLIYNNGAEGVPKDRKQAFDWFTKSAHLGNSYGMYFLASFYEYGEVVPKDTVKAAALYRQSAYAGNRYAQYLLGRCYETGVGVFVDEREALRWYQKSAENDFPLAEEAMQRLEKKQNDAGRL